jgi:hypothetical protein
MFRTKSFKQKVLNEKFRTKSFEQNVLNKKLSNKIILFIVWTEVGSLVRNFSKTEKKLKKEKIFLKHKKIFRRIKKTK